MLFIGNNVNIPSGIGNLRRFWLFILGRAGLDLEPIGPKAPNWVPCLRDPTLEVSTLGCQVHTTTHCMFNREQLGLALPKTGLDVRCFSQMSTTLFSMSVSNEGYSRNASCVLS